MPRRSTARRAAAAVATESAQESGLTGALPLTRVRLADYQPDPENANRMTDTQREQLAASLARWGYAQPIVVNRRTRLIVGGEHRWHELRKLGLTEADVLVLDLEADEASQLSVALNGVRGGLDPVKVHRVLEQLSDTERNATGYDVERWRETLRHVRDRQRLSSPAEPAQVVPTVRLGEVWRLGHHLLLCGDSSDADQVAALRAAYQADAGEPPAMLMLTDPPYGIGYDGENHPSSGYGREARKNWQHQPGHKFDGEGKSSDRPPSNNDDREARLQLTEAAIQHGLAVMLAEACGVYVWHDCLAHAELAAIYRRHGLLVHQQICWTKRKPVLGRTTYMAAHEVALFGWRRGHRPPRNRDVHMATTWDEPNETKKLHPTAKPVGLYRRPMEMHAVPGDVVYDPFAGSGTCIMAAEEKGCHALAIEIEPGYCDVIVARWEAMTGGKAAREGSVNEG